MKHIKGRILQLTDVVGDAVKVTEEGHVDGSKLAVHIAGLSKLILNYGRAVLFDVWRSIAYVEHPYSGDKHSQRVNGTSEEGVIWFLYRQREA